MSTSVNEPKLDSCGCCEAGVSQVEIYNRPGLPALDYRIGNHPKFLRRGLVHLPSQLVPPEDPEGTRPLADLTTRSGDDPSVALLDAWATVADVLTFYQERIVNEGYLRTATERRSVLELARTIGYELNPGVAASTFLAFAVEDAPGAPGMATVPLGTKVQSIPDQGHLPQTFETSAQITARAEWNALRPRLTRPQELAIREDKLYLLGLSTGFAPHTQGLTRIPVGEVYPLDPESTLSNVGEVQAVEVEQVYVTGTNMNLEAGDPLLLLGKRDGDTRALVRSIQHVEVEAELDRTRIVFDGVAADEPLPSPPPFAPPRLELATVRLGEMRLDQGNVENVIPQQSWRERDLAAFLSIQGWSGQNLVKHINAALRSRLSPSQLPPDDPGAFAFLVRCGFFGHNAPRFESLPEPTTHPNQNWDADPGWEIWKDPIANDNYTGADVYLERNLPGIASNSWIVLEKPTKQYAVFRIEAVSETSLTGFALSAKATGLKLDVIDKSSDFKVRTTTAHLQSERLELADLPIEDSLNRGTTSLQLDWMVLGLQADQQLVLSGERHDLPGVTGEEIVVLANIRHIGGYTVLDFKDGLRYSYVRETVTLNANVVPATHGETVTEVLGSGNGAQPNQRFTLKRPPLTHIPAPTVSGSQSTLQVQVDAVTWQEAPQLYDLDERSKSYIVRIEDDGTAHVIFGDGSRGAPLPTGTENVVATYRSGIGLSGMVGADKLTLLQTRPHGIREVTNPVPASGADEPESRDSARANAPLGVLTLDRVVSLRDFEDFALTFAGIGKTRAVTLWRAGTHLVHLTIAAVAPTAAPDADGSRSALATNVVERSSQLYVNLVEAIGRVSDPAQRFQIDSYQPLFFNVKAKVLVDPAYTPATVLSAVEAALKATFSFEQRDFGQPVTAAEVVTTIQGVPGVLATALDQLYRYRDDESPPDPEEQIILPEMLEAEQARLRGGEMELTQLLLVNPVGIRLEEMT